MGKKRSYLKTKIRTSYDESIHLHSQIRTLQTNFRTGTLQENAI